MSSKGFNYAQTYNRPQNTIAPPTQTPAAQPPINYQDYGYVPGYAQALQTNEIVNPNLQPQPPFTQDDMAAANWFTTRVHLSPLGKVKIHGKSQAGQS